MNFSKALKILKKGGLIARESQLDVVLYLVSNDTVTFAREDGNELAFPACIYMSYNSCDPERWHVAQCDILAEDWIEVEMED
jgi:hypothetical protein